MTRWAKLIPKDDEGETASEIAGQLGKNRTTVQSMLERCVKSGTVLVGYRGARRTKVYRMRGKK